MVEGMFNFAGLYLDKKHCRANVFVLIVGLKDRKLNLKIVADKMLEVPFTCVGDYVNVVEDEHVVGNYSISFGNTSATFVTYATFATSIVIGTSSDDKVDIKSLGIKVSCYVAHPNANYSMFLNFLVN
jgi:hypothetical protein